MKKRPPKSTDQEETEKAYQILFKTVKKHPEIERSLWAGALMSAFMDMHLQSGFGYKEFVEVLIDVKENYKKWLTKEKQE